MRRSLRGRRFRDARRCRIFSVIAATHRAGMCRGFTRAHARLETAPISTNSTYVSYVRCIKRCIYAPPFSLRLIRTGGSSWRQTRQLARRWRCRAPRRRQNQPRERRLVGRRRLASPQSARPRLARRPLASRQFVGPRRLARRPLASRQFVGRRRLGRPSLASRSRASRPLARLLRAAPRPLARAPLGRAPQPVVAPPLPGGSPEASRVVSTREPLAERRGPPVGPGSSICCDRGRPTGLGFLFRRTVSPAAAAARRSSRPPRSRRAARSAEAGVPAARRPGRRRSRPPRAAAPAATTPAR